MTKTHCITFLLARVIYYDARKDCKNIDKNSLLHEYGKYHVEKIGYLRDVTFSTESEISVCDKYMRPCLYK